MAAIDINVKNLSVHYGQVQALKDVSLTVMEKEFLGVIGPNGGGKSTLLKSIVGLIEPTSGEIQLRKGLKLGYVPQFTTFDKSFPINVRDVVLMGESVKHKKWFNRTQETSLKKSEELMAFLGIKQFENRQIGQLSGGQMQKVLIARALMNDPDVIAMDEPTASIDVKTKVEIYNLLRELNKDRTIIIVSHEVDSLMPYLDSVFCVNLTAHYYNKNCNDACQMHNHTKGHDEESYPGCPVRVFKEHELTHGGN